MNEGDYIKQEIFDEDKIGFYWKKMLSRTFIAREWEIKFQRILLLGANAAGDLTKMLIYHSENPRALKNE